MSGQPDLPYICQPDARIEDRTAWFAGRTTRRLNQLKWGNHVQASAVCRDSRAAVTSAQASTTYVLSNITLRQYLRHQPGHLRWLRHGHGGGRRRRRHHPHGSRLDLHRRRQRILRDDQRTTTLAPTYTPVTSPVNALPAGSEILSNAGYCNTVTFASTDVCSTTGYRSGYNVSSFRTGLTSAPTPATCGRPSTSPTSAPSTAPGRPLHPRHGRAAAADQAGAVREHRYHQLPAPDVHPHAGAGAGRRRLFGSALGLLGLARRKFAA